jgi:hypothetical protein
VTAATDELDRLREERGRAGARVSGLEAEWRAAQEAVAQAAAEVAELERSGGSASSRHKVEEQLAAAKAKAAEPWAERVDGARRAIRDHDQKLRAYTASNFDEIVTDIEARGAEAAARLNEAATAMLAAAADWNQAASQLGATLARVRNPDPFDVSRPSSEDAIRAVAALVAAGGEDGVRLDRTRPPWDTLLGGALEPEPEPAAVA